MLSRFTLVALVLGFLAGYAINSPSTTAQSVANGTLPFLVSAGDKLQLVYEHGTYQSYDTVNCVLAEVQGGWIRCAPRDPIATPREQQWHSLRRVVRITRQES